MTLAAVVACATLLGSIAGRVTDADSGAPIAGARVTIAGPGITTASSQLVTDEQGRFQRGGLAPGRYQVSAAARGYAAASGRWRESIVLDAADQLRETRFRLHRGAVIAGYITDDYGDPIANLSVSLIESTGPPSRMRGVSTALTVMTDDRGYYRFWGLRAGNYLVSARPSAADLAATRASAAPAATFYPGVHAASQAEAIAVTPAAVIDDINFGVRYGRVSTLAIRVVDATGAASRDARVSISDGNGGARAIAAFPGGSPGRFIVPQLPPGDYDIVAVGGRSGPGVSYAIHQVTISGDGAEVALELSLLTAAHVAGQVVAARDVRPQPATAMAVSSAASDGEAQFMRVPGDAVDPFTGAVTVDGRFSIAVLPGRRTLRLDGLAPGWAVQSITLNGREVLDREVTFSQGDAYNDARIIVTNQLRVVTAAVAGVGTDATVVLFSRDPGRWTPGTRSILRADVDGQGRVRIPGVLPGDYFIAAVPRDHSTRLLDPAVLAALAESALLLDVRAGEPAPIALTVTRP